MTRWIGAILVISSCTLMGFSVSRFFFTRANSLEAFLKLITHIESEIDGFLAPLDRIYASFRCPTLDESGFMESLIKESGCAAVKRHGARLCLCRAEKELLTSFFKELGHRGADGESKHCAYYKSKLRELCESAQSDAASKKRLCLSLGVLFGIMISVILI